MSEMQNENKFIKALKWFFHSFIWIGILTIILDIITKRLVVSYFADSFKEEIPLLFPGFFDIGYVLNYNAAFGLGLGSDEANRVVFIIVYFIAVIAISAIMAINYNKFNGLVKASLVLIASGAVGNCIDRLFYGPEFAVVDWIHFTLGDFDWPLFNVADSCVVIGVLILIIDLIVEDIKESKQNKAK